MKNTNEMQQQRATLAAEQEELTASLPDLEKAVTDAPPAWNHLGNPVGSPEWTAAHNVLSAAHSRIRSIANNIEALDIRMAYTERLVSADEQMAKALAEGKAATDQAARLRKSLGFVRERITGMQADSAQAKETAQQHEQNAANAIASATASGDGESAKEAQAMMAAAIEAGRKAEERDRTDQVLLRALETEAEALEKELAAAQQRADDAKQTAQNIERLKLHEEWNRAVEKLAAVGDRLVKAGERFTGFAGRSTLAVPTFGPMARNLTAEELQRRMKEKAA
jgi:hypothetical protein